MLLVVMLFFPMGRQWGQSERKGCNVYGRWFAFSFAAFWNLRLDNALATN